MRWAESVENFKSQGITLCGDVLLISAFVSYVGYFTKKYRNELMEKFWVPYINKLKVRSTVVVMTQGACGTPHKADAATLHPLGLSQPHFQGLTSFLACHKAASTCTQRLPPPLAHSSDMHPRATSSASSLFRLCGQYQLEAWKQSEQRQ